MFRRVPVSLAAAEKNAVRGIFLFTKNNFADHQSKVKKEQPELTQNNAFWAAKKSINAAWKELSQEQRISQGYYTEGFTPKPYTPKPKSATAAGGAKKFGRGGKKTFTKTSNAASEKKKGPVSGSFLFTKNKWAETFAKVKKDQSDLTPSEAFGATKRSIMAAWKDLSKEDRVAQGYWTLEFTPKPKSAAGGSRYGGAKKTFTKKAGGASEKKKAQGPLKGSFLFTKNKWADYNAAFIKANPTVTVKKDQFWGTKKAINAAWKEMSQEEKTAQGY